MPETRKSAVIFIGPIVGMPPSLAATFGALRDHGIAFEGVDIFEGQKHPRTFWKVLGLTALPGSADRRIRFANTYDEEALFYAIVQRIDRLRKQGITRIVLGGMSGGFVFASRLVQSPADAETTPYADDVAPLVDGLFGISPLIFYPLGVTRVGALLERVPQHIPTVLVWGDGDSIVPEGTIAYAKNVAASHPRMECLVIDGPSVGSPLGSVHHQFFGGRDFIGFLHNTYWHPAAERVVLRKILDLVNIAP